MNHAKKHLDYTTPFSINVWTLNSSQNNKKKGGNFDPFKNKWVDLWLCFISNR